MENTLNETPSNKWLSVPVIATVTRLLCRELTLQNEYFRQENKILRSKINKRISFTDDERRTLVESAIAMGKDLMEQVVTIVKPQTIFAWQRRLENQKWDYSDRRKNNPGRPRIAFDIEELVCKMARENEWGYARIQGELKKLDITISKSSVANILSLHTRYMKRMPADIENLKTGGHLYCLGHLLQAAIAYYQATGDEQLL